MLDAALPSEPPAAVVPPGAAPHQRARAEAGVRFAVDGTGRTRLADLRQSGSGKCLLPRVPNALPEAVFLNTAGGIAGGDRLSWTAAVDAGAAAVVTTQAAERLYRSDGTDGIVRSTARLGAGARLDWLPQETIAFDGARLRRSLDIEMAADADLLMLEILVLGRVAMGETVGDLHLHDVRRIRRAGRIVFLDAVRLVPPVSAILAGAAGGDGPRAVATLVHVAPDAEDGLDRARAVLDTVGAAGVTAAVSAWDGLLCLRAAARRPAALRAVFARFVSTWRGPLPRVWRM